MDKSKSPGIKFNQVILKKSIFERMEKIVDEHTSMDVNFNINNRINTEKTKLITEFSIAIGNRDNTPLYMEVSMIGIFSIDKKNRNMDLEAFSKQNAPALILPYIREYVSNTTMRAGFKSPFILPPINIVRLMKEKEKEK